MDEELMKKVADIIKKASKEGKLSELADAISEAAIDDDDLFGGPKVHIASISLSFGVKGDRNAAQAFIREIGETLTMKFNKSFENETEINVNGESITVQLVESTGSLMDPESFMELRKMRRDFANKIKK